MHKTGFTTQTFREPLIAGKITLEEILEWGAKHQVDWMEIRDFNLDFSEKKIRQIVKTATDLGIRPHYAWDTTCVHNPADRERIARGIRNAALFGEGTSSRIVIAPDLINAPAGKAGYSITELGTIYRNLKHYIAEADQAGVTLVFENSLETIQGFEQLLEAVPELKMTFDTANFIAGSRNGTSGEDVLNFSNHWKTRAPYVHLKSCRNGILQNDLLADGDVPLQKLILLLSRETLLCVELPPTGNIDCCRRRVDAGLKLLRSILTV